MAILAPTYRKAIERRSTASKDENEAKQNKHKHQRKASWHLQTNRPEDTSSRHLWLVNKGEPTSTSPLTLAILSLILHVTFGHITACRSPALTFSAAIYFAMKCSAPCSAVLRHPPSSWAAVVHWSALMPKAPRPSRKHPIHYFFWPPTQPAPPTNSQNISHSGSIVSSIRATNPANKILLLRKVASVLSLPS